VAVAASLYLPHGIYKISAAITVPVNGKIVFRGDGMSATILRQSNASANGIVFSRDNYITSGGGVEDMTIEAGAGLESAGSFSCNNTNVGLYVIRGHDGFYTKNISINNFGTGLGLFGCRYTR